MVVYASQLELTYCLPTVNPETIADYLIGVSGLQKYFADVAVGWPLILAMTGVALAISIITSVLIRYLAGPVVWFMIVVLFLLELLLGLIGILISDLVWLQELVHYNELP